MATTKNSGPAPGPVKSVQNDLGCAGHALESQACAHEKLKALFDLICEDPHNAKRVSVLADIGSELAADWQNHANVAREDVNAALKEARQ